MEQLDNDWENFLINNEINELTKNNDDNSSLIDNDNIKDSNIKYQIDNNIINSDLSKEKPKGSDIYISTKTKIVFLNQEINLYDIFWKIPLLDYYTPKNGIIKKQIKMTSLNKYESKKIDNYLSKEKNYKQTLLSFVDNNNNYKKIQKISVGLCKKDLLSYRTKEKGAFYNCFALIFRIKQENIFKEVHLKVFNTGKLEIPGIQDDEILYKTLEQLIKTLQPFIKENIYYIKNEIDTVLINSNFNCGYYINRDEIFKLLKMKYKLICMYDPCSYPGIQCKFYYNKNKKIQNGICDCVKTCNKKNGKNKCKEISFMIFRTGSVLIVGNCNEKILYVIYNFIKTILEDEYEYINEGLIDINNLKSKKQTKKSKYREIIIDL